MPSVFALFLVLTVLEVLGYPRIPLMNFILLVLAAIGSDLISSQPIYISLTIPPSRRLGPPPPNRPDQDSGGGEAPLGGLGNPLERGGPPHDRLIGA